MLANVRILLIAVFGLIFSTAAQAVPVETLNRTVAVVNGEMISLYDLDLQAAPALLQANIDPKDPAAGAKVEALRKQVLDSMILDILLKKEAERLKITVSDDEVENELNMMMERNRNSSEDLQRRLAAQGMTMDMLKERIRRSIINQRLITMMIYRKIVVPKEDVVKFYNDHPGAFVKDRALDVQLIVFDKKTDSKDIAEKIRSGILSFDDAAKKYSVGPRAKEGGRMGTIYWTELSREWQQMIMGLKPGVLSNVFDLDGLDAVLRVNSIIPGSSLSLEEAMPQIEEYLKQPLIEARFNDYVAQLRNKAVIEIRY